MPRPPHPAKQGRVGGIDDRLEFQHRYVAFNHVDARRHGRQGAHGYAHASTATNARASRSAYSGTRDTTTSGIRGICPS